MSAPSHPRSVVALVAGALALLAAAPAATTPPPYLDPDRPVAERVEDLLGRLTLDEKIAR